MDGPSQTELKIQSAERERPGKATEASQFQKKFLKNPYPDSLGVNSNGYPIYKSNGTKPMKILRTMFDLESI